MSNTTVFGSSAILAVLGDDTLTPDMASDIEFMDADEELREIASFISEHSPYNEEVEVGKIKFLYTTNFKKEGGRHAVGSLIVRSAMEKAIDDRYDYIICLIHPIWKNLDTVTKTIQLDKLMCGINVSYKNDGTKKFSKATQNSREYLDNLRFFGADKVIDSSDLVHQTGTQIEDQMKDEKKKTKETGGGGVDFAQFIKGGEDA